MSDGLSNFLWFMSGAATGIILCILSDIAKEAIKDFRPMTTRDQIAAVLREALLAERDLLDRFTMTFRHGVIESALADTVARALAARVAAMPGLCILPEPPKMRGDDCK